MMASLFTRSFAAICVCLATLCFVPHVSGAEPAERIVNLGDSITDGQTYALLVEQAYREARIDPPRFFGAGIGGDTSGGMLKRLDRDVFVHHPTMVMLSCGINDASSGVPTADFEANVTAIAKRMRDEKVRLMILTTTSVAPGLASFEPKLDEVNAILHRVAREYGLPVAEVYERMKGAQKSEPELWMDDVHLNLAGFRAMARAVLDARGDANVKVPTELHPPLLPGVIQRWNILPIKKNDKPLTAETVAQLKPDGEWKPYTLPESKRLENFWLDQERQRGVAISLAETCGPAERYDAIATVDSDVQRNAYINLGGELQSAWLNGKCLFGPGDPNRGWHPGAYRIPVHLQAGRNEIVVETSAHFFLSVTDTADW